jgi:ribonuclease R
MKTKKNPTAKPTTIVDPHAAREAQRYAKPIPSREALITVLEAANGPLNFTDVCKALKLRGPEAVDALHKRLGAMVRDGQLLLNRSEEFALPARLDVLQGTIIANSEGFGFLRPDGGGDDVFLPPYQMRQVLHGDRAMVNVTGVDSRGRREGMIVSVVARRSPRVVGRYLEESGFGVVTPDDRRIHQEVLIPRGQSLGARPGDVVVAEIVEQPSQHRGPVGKVIRVIGADVGPGHFIELAIESFGLPQMWPSSMNVALSVIPDVVEPWQCEGRTDLRDIPLVTIDGEDARDFDDAVYAEPLKAGGFKLIVAIADVASYVVPGSVLDDEAKLRGTSAYFPSKVIPMLPEKLSNGICSLKPDVDRLCLTCEMQIDATGVVKKSRFYPAVMRSKQRLTYNLVWAAIGERDAGARERVKAVLPQLEALNTLYKLLAAQRKIRGAIDFEGAEVRFGFDEQGEVALVQRYERNDAHKIIEECMIAANVAAAQFVSKAKIPALYRVHAPPPISKYEDAKEFLAEMGLKLPEHQDVTPLDFAALLKKIRKRPDAGLIESLLLRTQSLAVYQPDNGGHFGLALDSYGHFTSPIRRYPDLLLHRAIYHVFAKQKAQNYTYSETQMLELGKLCSTNERRAEEASRDVNDRLKCAWMEKHVGEKFTGLVVAVTSFGAFVELPDSRVTGLIHVTQLPQDYFHFDAKRHRLVGERTRACIALADSVSIQVLRVDQRERRIDFKLLSELKVVSVKEAQKVPRHLAPSERKGGGNRAGKQAGFQRAGGGKRGGRR